MLNLKNQSLLVIAPHPDDEVIGCAGLIQKVKELNGKVYVLFLTVADTNDFSKVGFSSLKNRKSEIENVSKFLKFDKFHIALEGNGYHLKLDTLGQEKIMNIIERESPVALEKIKPTMVVFPSINSYNQDHKIVAHAVHASLRPSDNKTKHFVPNVMSYEEPSDAWSLSVQESPNIFITLSKVEIKTKLKAMRLYSSQMRNFPNMRSLKILETLATLRGSMIGEEFAESFISYRLVI